MLTSKGAADNDAIFAIHGDYYGFHEDGILIRNGVIYRDSPARTGLAIYANGEMEIYEEPETSATTSWMMGFRVCQADDRNHFISSQLLDAKKVRVLPLPG